MKISLAKNSQMKDLDCGAFFAFNIRQKSSQKSSFNKSVIFDDLVKDLDKKSKGILLAEADKEGFLGKAGQVFTLNTLNTFDPSNIALLGMGEKEEISLDNFAVATGNFVKLMNKKRCNKVAIVIDDTYGLPIFDLIVHISLGAYLSMYTFDRHLSKDKQESFVKELKILLPSEVTKSHDQALKRACAIKDGIFIARDLINEGPSIMNPQMMAKEAMKVAKDHGLMIDVLDEKALKKENMNLFLAVGAAALEKAPPRLITINYTPEKKAKKHVALIGKGVTFDSGGLNIKPADGMLTMKVDMSGAAAVLGIMKVIAQLKPNVAVTGYMGCVENGISAHSYHQGDVIIAKSGLSVEITNTDAEGRLVLADTMTYCQEKNKPDYMIDMATLTGACMIALGVKTAGLFSNDDELASTIKSFGKTMGEKYWQLPLDEELKESLKSNVADIKNCGNRYGGAITASLFLQEFVQRDVKWAHLDIAGPATNEKPHAYLSNGGAGFAVKTLVEFISSLG